MLKAEVIGMLKTREAIKNSNDLKSAGMEYNAKNDTIKFLNSGVEHIAHLNFKDDIYVVTGMRGSTPCVYFPSDKDLTKLTKRILTVNP